MLPAENETVIQEGTPVVDTIYGTGAPTEPQLPQSQPGQQDNVPDQQGQPAPAQSQQSWNPNEYALNFHGRTILPRDKEHLVNLAQQGYSYSQSMAILKKEKEELEGTKQKFGQYEQFDTLLQQNPQIAQKIWALFTEQNNNNNNGAAPENQVTLPPEIVHKLTEFDRFTAEYRAEKADSLLSKELSELRKMYPDQAWDTDVDGRGTLEDRVLQHAYANGIGNIKMAYKDLMWDTVQTQAKSDVLKAEQEKKAAARRAGIVDGGQPPAGMAPAAPMYKKGSSYHDLQEAALKSLGV
jgi:hypothetical protein